MNIDVILTPGDINNGLKINRDVAVAVIDVLRVSSTIVTAMENGAATIYPVMTVKEAFDKRQQLTDEGISPDIILLGGERDSLLIPGFDMGNSPFEYTREKIGGKILILSSTNGTKALNRSSNAGTIITGCIRNAEAAAMHLLAENSNVLFYLSGRIGDFSMEDALGAGIIINIIRNHRTVEMSDSAMMCLDLADKYAANSAEMLKKSYHGRYLISLGLEKEVDYCSEQDKSHIVPIYSGGRLIKKV